jgi:FtsP/CotA-like multicopper oxidase with cupredoxin domain
MLETNLTKLSFVCYLVVSLALTGMLSICFAPVDATPTTEKPIPAEEYDKLKNCTTNLSKRPTSIEYLTYFNCGHVSTNENGQTVREFTLIVDENQKIPISEEGHVADGWTFNNTIPGPTIRVTEGDLVRIKVINSAGNEHAHSLHTHSIHSAQVDGVSMGGYQGGTISPGNSFVYEFVASPYGVYPYHCHVDPIADHINRGLYGMMIIDPKQPRAHMVEFAMLMNGYDLDYDQEGQTTIDPISHELKGVEKHGSHDQSNASEISRVISTGDGQHKKVETVTISKAQNSNTKSAEKDTEDKTPSATSEDANSGPEDNETGAPEEEERDNEIYTVNGKAFEYMKNPISIQTGKPYRIYLVNMLEFDLVNSFHMHGAMFNYITAGTDETPDFKTDIVTLSQGDRGILEFQYDYPGKYMFHAHVTEFTDLGWMGLFDAKTGASTY